MTNLHQRTARVLRQSQEHTHSRVQVLSASEGSDVSMETSQSKRESRTTIPITLRLQLVKAELRHRGDELEMEEVYANIDGYFPLSTHAY